MHKKSDGPAPRGLNGKPAAPRFLKSPQEGDTPIVPDRPGITVSEIAKKYRRSRSRVASYWVRNPKWKAHVRIVGKRGRAVEFDTDDVHELLREWIWLPPATTDVAPNRLLNQHEIADYSGIGYKVVRSDSTDTKGVLGEPDGVRNGVRMWLRSTVDDRYWARQIRGRSTE